MILFNLCLVATATLASVLAQSPAVVVIKPGTVNGATCANSAVKSFLSIPYAQPPVGDLRFAPPQLFQGSYQGGSLNATSRAPSCIQFGTTFVEPGPQSEDCLYLDIWVPAHATTGSKLPVKFWIYGGANDGGSISDPLYSGCNLATDSIVVSANYRLGALGFLSLESAGIAGNFAVQDLLLALQWVQDNIDAFGGDPRKVLLFGQSAGAVLTWILSSLPQAPTLISAAISESGAGRTVATKAQYQEFGLTYANALGCNSTDITCFRSKSTIALNTSLGSTPATSITSPNQFHPFVDGKLIPVDPLATGSKVPFIAGSNTMEGTLYPLSQFGGPTSVTAADYATFLQNNFGQLASVVNQYYPVALFNSTPFPAYYAISTVITYAAYFCPARRALEATSKAGKPAWTYRSSHVPTCGWEPGLGAAALELLGATHASEIPLVFSQLTNLPLPPNGNCSLDSQEVEISKILVSAWTSMATTGTPGDGAGILGGPWPQYNVNASGGLLISNVSSVGYVNYTICDFWDKIAAAEANLTTTSNSSSPGSANATSSSGPSSTSSSSMATFTGGTTNILKALGIGFLAMTVTVASTVML